jgi:Family of unknown function (DUF6447)
MLTLSLDGREFEIDKLPQAATVQLTNLHFMDAEIARSQALLAVMHTARDTYLEALRVALPAS